jgi:hypothetical protein
MADSFATQPIAPVNPVIGVRPVEVAAPNQQATAAQTQLAVLPAGTIIEGFVLKRDNQNNPILRTPLGDLQLQSQVFLKTGSQVIFRVDTTTASRARIVTIDGLEPDDYAAQATKSLSTDTVEPSPLPRTQPQSASAALREPVNHASLPGLLLNKTVTANPSNNVLIPSRIISDTPLPAALQQLVSGSALKITVLDLQFPPPAPVQASAVNAPVQNTAQPLATGAPQPLAPTPVHTASLPATASTTPVIQTFAESLLNMAPNTTPTTAPTMNPPGNNATTLLTASNPSVIAAPAPPIQTTSAPAPHALIGTSPTSPTTATATSSPITSSASAAIATPQPLPAPTVIATTAPTVPTLPQSITPDREPASPATSPPRLALHGLQAVVIGHEPDGGNVLHSDLGTIKLFTPRPLPVGSALTLDVKPDEPIGQDSLAPTANALVASPLTPRSRDWPLLNEIAKPFPDAPLSSPLPSLPLLPQIPVANAALTSGLLGFMAAVQSGDARQWLGARALEKLNTDFPKIAARLKLDVEQMQDMWNNSPLQNWSSMLLPINVQGQIEHARLYIRDEEPSLTSANKLSGGGQRFIMEVNLSHLGDMQFDGFVQSKSTKQFDLVIRTSLAIEPTLANEIRGIFESAAHSTGYGGHLSFQRGEQHFVRPLAEMKANSSDFHTILA